MINRGATDGHKQTSYLGIQSHIVQNRRKMKKGEKQILKFQRAIKISFHWLIYAATKAFEMVVVDSQAIIFIVVNVTW